MSVRLGWCDRCQATCVFHEQDLALGWGCLLSILTGGLFLILWIPLAILSAFRPYRCRGCGATKYFRS